jgi:hypothetical protein
VAAAENLDDAVAGQVQVVAGVAVRAVQVAAKGEDEYEGAVDAFGVEDLQQLVQVRRQGQVLSSARLA